MHQTRVLHSSAYTHAELSALRFLPTLKDPDPATLGNALWDSWKCRLPATAILRRLEHLGLVQKLDANNWGVTDNGRAVLETLKP